MPPAAHALQAPRPVLPPAKPWRRRLRLVASSVAWPCDRHDRAALLRELDLRRRRAQIAARHALGL